jgi:hypothetical protein
MHYHDCAPCGPLADPAASVARLPRRCRRHGNVHYSVRQTLATCVSTMYLRISQRNIPWRDQHPTTSIISPTIFALGFQNTCAAKHARTATPALLAVTFGGHPTFRDGHPYGSLCGLHKCMHTWLSRQHVTRTRTGKREDVDMVKVAYNQVLTGSVS